jgi:hypothetical protein
MKDLETVSWLRSARVSAVSRSRSGDVVSVLLSEPSSLDAQVYVVKLLDVYPALGKVAGRRLMAELGIAPLTRVAELTTEQLSMLQAAIGGLHE